MAISQDWLDGESWFFGMFHICGYSWFSKKKKFKNPAQIFFSLVLITLCQIRRCLNPFILGLKIFLCSLEPNEEIMRFSWRRFSLYWNNGDASSSQKWPKIDVKAEKFFSSLLIIISFTHDTFLLKRNLKNIFEFFHFQKRQF